MNPVYGIAQSGLQVASLQLANSANNVANANTDGFVPSQVVAQAAPGGGVTASVEPPESSPAVQAQMDRNIVSLSGTDLVQETVDQTAAAASFRANLATLATAQEMDQTLMSIKS